MEDIDYRAARGLDKAVMRALAKDSAWVRNHENIFVIGPCGVGTEDEIRTLRSGVSIWRVASGSFA